ncbi:MAG: Nucleoside-diphosphate-sugar epimerase [Segetibacter sp.]|nr:Nucleoside-diphosphate-sugar epimerase [Segetibacter sp.]
MNICIIGGSGFIGGYLIDILKRDHSVLNIDKIRSSLHSDIAFNECDIRDYKKLKQSIPSTTDFIVLLAAEHRDDVSPTSLYYEVNVEGTHNVLKIMNEKHIENILFTSSVSVYGLNKNNPDEFSPADPFNHYGKSKLEAEEVLRRWFDNDQNGKTLIILRPTVIFGPGNRGNVYNLLAQISLGKFLMVGKGTNKKSMAYVENLAGFISHCINSGSKKFHLYNYVDKPDLTTTELVEQAELAIGKKILPVKIPYWVGFATAKILDIVFGLLKKKNSLSAVRVKKFCATTQFDSATIQATGYIAPFTLAKGLEITIKSITENKKIIFSERLTPIITASI